MLPAVETGAHFLTLAETAGEIGLPERRFRAERRSLIERHGFPPPLPGLTPPKWSRRLVLAWIDSGGGQSARLANDNLGRLGLSPAAAAREALKARREERVA